MNYTAFVKSRAKWLPTFADDILHACVGICGETIELAYAIDEKNEREEIGDVLFYVEHAGLALARWDIAMPLTYDKVYEEYSRIDVLERHSGDLLDFAKKLWVYKKPPEEVPLLSCLVLYTNRLHRYIEKLGWTVEELQAENKAKLEKRYPTGYSDAAAQARLDKPKGE